MRPTYFNVAVGCIVTLLATGVCRADDRGTLVVERPGGTPYGYTHHVYVNDEKVGEVKGDEKKSFKFTPARDGKNRLEVIQYDVIGVKQRMLTETFEAWAGADVYCYSEHDTSRSSVRVRDAGARPVKATKVELRAITIDPELTTKEVKTKIFETPDGIEQEYEISQTIERSVSFSKTLTTEYGGKINFAIIGGDIRKKIESEERITFKQTETIRRTLKINGTKTPKVKVVWVESGKTGKATVVIDGEEKQIPFSLPVEVDPIITVIKE
jgi:hypothetical protein